jgi:fructose/tagatose bisphosphate aldolase
MVTLREVLKHAETEGVAIGHFNVSDWVTLKAIFESASDRNVPVIVGVSESERQFLGVRQIAAMVTSLREEYDFPIFLNADHSHSLASAMEAAKAGFDSIVFDASALPLEENIRQTRTAVDIIKAIRPEILVEGEIGDIGSGSEIHDTARPA